ncbi:MAG TPA: hypothetical protein VMU04_18260 [Candidatus Acidoferrum sp.]|nr:hypothetical protein [Candidatus Acidoferrum sp.]
MPKQARVMFPPKPGVVGLDKTANHPGSYRGSALFSLYARRILTLDNIVS